VQARWLEELVWADVRSFLHDSGEVLERVKEQMAAKDESDGLEKRRASLTKRLATKQAEKDRYVRLYATGHLDEEELDTYLADVSNQVENLKLLISSVEADLTLAQEEKALAASTEAWLVSLRENLEEVEADTEEAFTKRRELVKLLVEKIAASRDEEGRAKVDITYRFGPPAEEHAGSGVSGERNSVEFDLKNVWEDGETMTGLFSMSDQRYKPWRRQEPSGEQVWKKGESLWIAGPRRAAKTGAKGPQTRLRAASKRPQAP
jgi:hypothetical protein